MTSSQKYFLVVADELNISRAAEKLFISQQCLSNHIKRLEEMYDKLLFQRKPKLTLTHAGQKLAFTLRQIQMLENSLEHQLQDMEHGAESVFRIGMHSLRAQALLPLILPEYKRKYPELRLHIYSNVAREMEQMLLRGQLDLFISHYPVASPKIREIHLMNESLYLIITDNLLEEYFPDIYPNCKEVFNKGVDITDFKDVPFILHLESSYLHMSIQQLFAKNGIFPKLTIQTNITEMQSVFSAMNFGASFCFGTMLHFIRQHTSTINKINIFPIRDHALSYRVAIVYLEGAYLPLYALDFIQSAQSVFGRITAELLPIVGA